MALVVIVGWATAWIQCWSGLGLFSAGHLFRQLRSQLLRTNAFHLFSVYCSRFEKQITVMRIDWWVNIDLTEFIFLKNLNLTDILRLECYYLTKLK